MPWRAVHSPPRTAVADIAHGAVFAVPAQPAAAPAQQAAQISGPSRSPRSYRLGYSRLPFDKGRAEQLRASARRRPPSPDSSGRDFSELASYARVATPLPPPQRAPGRSIHPRGDHGSAARVSHPRDERSPARARIRSRVPCSICSASRARDTLIPPARAIDERPGALRGASRSRCRRSSTRRVPDATDDVIDVSATRRSSSSRPRRPALLVLTVEETPDRSSGRVRLA